MRRIHFDEKKRVFDSFDVTLHERDYNFEKFFQWKQTNWPLQQALI